MRIAAARLASAVVASSLLAALSGCGSMGSYGTGGNTPPTEQARLRLIDQCVYEASKTANALKDRITPRCQCYARGALRQMSPGEIASVAGGGSVPFSVRTQEIMNACAAHGNAFSEAPHKTGVKKKKKPEGEAPPSSDAAPSSEPPAPPSSSPPAPPSGGEPPKQQ